MSMVRRDAVEDLKKEIKVSGREREGEESTRERILDRGWQTIY